jgi:hypothetical protein
MELVEYMGKMESTVSDLLLRVAALETAVTAMPHLTLETDPTKTAVVVPDYSAQVPQPVFADTPIPVVAA